MEKVKLNNGIQMPWIDLGVFRIEDDDEVQRVVETALKIGYRHIDTAMYYHNEEAVGKTINSLNENKRIGPDPDHVDF